jgi:hypothetical protein
MKTVEIHTHLGTAADMMTVTPRKTSTTGVDRLSENENGNENERPSSVKRSESGLDEHRLFLKKDMGEPVLVQWYWENERRKTLILFLGHVDGHRLRSQKEKSRRRRSSSGEMPRPNRLHRLVYGSGR